MDELLKVPGIILILGGILYPLLRERVNKVWLLLLPILSFMQLLTMDIGYQWQVSIFEITLMPVRIDALSLVWGYVFHIAAFICVLYALHVDDQVQQVSGLIYAGCAITATFAGDLGTLFFCWEVTAISSVFLIWTRGTPKSRQAGSRYLLIQVLSGVLLLAGAMFRLAETHTLEFGPMALTNLGTFSLLNVGNLLIFFAFGLKAAFPFLHSWLPDAYPEGTATGTVYLSAFTTKLAIYALARGFAGTEALIYIGAAMTLYPIFYAVIENDLRRVLSYSLNNQLGFMVVGIGIGTQLSLNGTAAHAFAHVIYKSLLFMSMGAVLHRTGTIKASELGGLFKSMPLTTVFCIIGSLSIAGFPGFSGFVSKSMILAEVAAGHWLWISLILLVATAGVVDHSGIKIPFFSFFYHDSGKRVKEAPLNMLMAMGIAAAFCIGIGLFPEILYGILPYPDEALEYRKHVFSYGHVMTSIQLLLFAALAFVFMLRSGWYPKEESATNLDVDWFYRRIFPRLYQVFIQITSKCYLEMAVRTKIVAHTVNRVLSKHCRPGGIMGEPWTTSRTTVWIALLMAVYLLFSYLR